MYWKCGFVHMYMYVWSEVSIRCLSHLLSTLFSEVGSLTEFEAH